jgi:hypothetical protein
MREGGLPEDHSNSGASVDPLDGPENHDRKADRTNLSAGRYNRADDRRVVEARDVAP